MESKSELVRLPIVTSEGEFVAGYSVKGLAELNFPSKSSTKKSIGGEVSAKIRRWHRVTTEAVKQTLAGRAVKNPPPLDLSRGTEFQRAVWTAMRRISCGQTQSYGEIAKAIGKPKAVRAVGGACGANPIPVLVPCHRVLAAGGKIGGFSGGLDWKRKLLAREGVRQ